MRSILWRATPPGHTPEPLFASSVSSSLCRGAAEQLLRREATALRERLELRPHDARVNALRERALGKAAVGAAQDVLSADDAGEPHQAFRHQLGMLHDVGGMADDA